MDVIVTTTNETYPWPSKYLSLKKKKSIERVDKYIYILSLFNKILRKDYEAFFKL